MRHARAHLADHLGVGAGLHDSHLRVHPWVFFPADLGLWCVLVLDFFNLLVDWNWACALGFCLGLRPGSGSAPGSFADIAANLGNVLQFELGDTACLDKLLLPLSGDNFIAEAGEMIGPPGPAHPA